MEKWNKEDYQKTVIIIGFNNCESPYQFLVLKIWKQNWLKFLQQLGIKISKIWGVINKLSVEDTQTRYKSTVYKVMFLIMI